MASKNKAQEICQTIEKTLLKERVSDYHIFELAQDIVDWEEIAPSLHITASERKEIKENYHGRYSCQKREALFVWRCKNDKAATYKNLIKILCFQNLFKHAEMLADDLRQNRLRLSPNRATDMLYGYLCDCYCSVPHPSAEQWPSNCTVIFSRQCYIELSLYESSIDDLQGMCNIIPATDDLKRTDLQQALKGDKLLVFFEGIAGSGKTTLSWHICREWAEKKLLQQFKLLIHVQVNHPQIQSAECFSDLIPWPNSGYDRETSKEVASVIFAMKGRGTCLLLEGLDEASVHLQNFLIKDLIQKRIMGALPELSFIVTSRPNLKVNLHLQSMLKNKIILQGFDSDKLNQFLDISLADSGDKRKALKRKFEINPRLVALCSLPINAVIMVFLITLVDILPKTQFGLYKPLLCNVLVRHAQTRTENGAEIGPIEDLVSDVPLVIKKSFEQLCRYAFQASLRMKRLFSAKDLDNAKVSIDNTLGLLNIHPKLYIYGPERYYSFSHLSVQHFLAALHLSQMEKHRQTVAFKCLLDQDPLAQILTFYAAFTRLANDDVVNLLTKALGACSDNFTIMKEISKSHEVSNDPRRRALALINCLYESENDALLYASGTDPVLNTSIDSGMKDLTQKAKSENSPFVADLSLMKYRTITLTCLPLTPLDCMSLGYYARIKSLSMRGLITVQLMLPYCSINGIGMKVLVNELKVGITFRTEARVHLIFSNNIFDLVCVESVKELVKGQSNIEAICIRGCLTSKTLNTNYSLKHITEGLALNSSCKTIDLSENALNQTHILHIVLMIRSCYQLQWIELNYSNFRSSIAISLLCEAIRISRLQSLNLNLCNIDDYGLHKLGKAVCQHKHMYHLQISDNAFSNEALENFLTYFLNPHSILIYLHIGRLTTAHKKVIERINLFRTLIFRQHLSPFSYQSLVQTQRGSQALHKLGALPPKFSKRENH